MKLSKQSIVPDKNSKRSVHRKYKKIILWSASFAIVCVAIASSLFIYDYDVGFSAPSHPDFVGYEPTVLPSNIRIAGQSLTRQHYPGMDKWNFYYSLQPNSSDLTINESSRENAVLTDPIDCQGFGGVCKIYHSPRGNAYRVWYSTQNNKPYGLQVDWAENNTAVTIEVKDSAATKYLSYNWNPVFDSMQPVDLSHLHFTKYNSCGCGG